MAAIGTIQPSHVAVADAEVTAVIEAARKDVEAAPVVYRPGDFWEELIDVNLEMLRTHGIANFKRTIANNYYQWLTTSLNDPQMQRAIRRWLEHPSLAPFVNRLEERPSGLRTTISEGTFDMSSAAASRYKFFAGALWETARREDRLGLTDRLTEPALGNPIRFRQRGRLVSQDLANSIIECNYLARSGALRPGCRVAELGAGYGRLAYVFSEACPLTYCIFDVPPALGVAQWYLTELFGADRTVPYMPGEDFRAVESRLKPGTIAFFTPNQLAMFPDGWFDCTQTISTLPEMPVEQSQHYLQLLSAKSRRALFLKQWKQWPNPADDVELTEDSYSLPDPWRLAARRADPIQPAFFNQLWMRP
jgi:putative sugar O-methyltransferase